MLKKWREEKVKKKSLKWGGILLAFVMSLGTTVGFLGAKSARAFEDDPDYWTITTSNNVSMTIVLVEQNGVEIAPQRSDYIFNWDVYAFGDYYFPVANNSDKVRIGILVEGIPEGATYYAFDGVELTSEDNGTVVYNEQKPHVYDYHMQDSHENEMTTPLANEYMVTATLRNSNWSDSVSRDIIVRPACAGSSDVEIVSVQQNGSEVYLDTEGWHITTTDEMKDVLQTINEYTLYDYGDPVEVTYKFKHLEVGKHYSYSAGGQYDSFLADATEKTFTSEIDLNYNSKHIDTTIGLYGPGDYNESNTVSLYFRVDNNGFAPLGDVVISAITQGEEQITPSLTMNGYLREYTFDVNDVQPISVSLHTVRATYDMDYYISYRVCSEHYSCLYSEEPLIVNGEDFERLGVELTIPSGYGLSEESPMELTINVSTNESNMGYFTGWVIYDNYASPQQASDKILFNYYEDDELPRYTAAIGYTNSDEEIYDVINAKYHDEDNPLWVKVMGERYDNETIYEVRAKVGVGDGSIYDQTFTATGAELNAGKTFVLNDLVLSLPEFDPSGSSSGYELYYDFSLEVNGLEQKGTMYYMYDGYIYTVMTYAGGKVAANGNEGGGVGAMYMSSSVMTVRRSSLSSTREATLNYRGSGFDEDLSYNYAVYYNGNAGDEWWSAPAGLKLEEGVLTGRDLNNARMSINVAVPENVSESAMYSLVITRNGGLVIVVKDFLRFVDDPMIESFTFHADDDSFMQTGQESYRLARGANATATLTGAGFDNAEDYKLWVFYSGHSFAGEYPEEVDLEDLNVVETVTGEQLNAGYNYALNYDEALDGADEVNVIFIVTDEDNEMPDRYAEHEEGVYSGHSIYIDYVYENDVFNADDGFQINTETGEITDVAQPDDHHGGDEMIDNRTVGRAEASIEDSTLTLTAVEPCVVLGVNNGAYTVVEAGMGEIVEGVTTNLYDVSGYESVVVALKGDVNFDGKVTSADTNLINRSLISNTLPPYRDLSDLESMVADVSGDSNVTSADTNLINRSLISDSLPAYQALEW